MLVRPTGRRTQHRMRLVAVCVLLTAVVFRQEPGRLAPDTKLDLVVDPTHFLARALHLWEPLGFFGQVQNQAYGYLFPMGPFFAMGDLLALPPWAVQRAWVSLLVCVAFLGTVRLARLVGISSPTARIVAGLAYALAPRMITVLGAASVEGLPAAMAPWVLVPLVAGAVRGSPRRAAAWSGLAVLCAGGVNAAATLAVLPLPALWLLTREPGRRRRQLMLWWAGAVGLATLWWVVPLLLLGRYSPPFLDFIESARITTIPTNLVELLRGTSHWLAFLADDDGPVWRAGWLLVTTPVLIVDTVLLAAAGLVALTRRDMPERSWAVFGLTTGVVLVGFGHVSSVDGLFAADMRDLLDGPLAPLRNVHKFDPVLRLPLVLGLAHLLGVLATRRPRASDRSGTVVRFAVYAAVAAVLAGSAAPLILNRLVPRGSYAAVPDYWREAAGFLAAEGATDRALLVPAARFGTYYWGDPRDEPLQPLASSPWAVRDAVPLAQPGNIRMLDAIERRLASGRGSPGLAAFLARAGVGHLVVRNDLDYARAGSPRPVLVHQALADSPGLRLVARFGPFVGGGAGRSDLVVDQQLDRPYRAVEIFEVTRTTSLVSAHPLSDVPVVVGGPESLLELTDKGWLGQEPAVLAADRPSWLDASSLVVTDGFRRREVTFGRIEDNASAVMTADQPRRLAGTARDYLPDSVARGGAASRLPSSSTETVARIEGASALAASSSASDPDAFASTRPEHQPFAAFDGDAGTAWISGGVGGAVGEWLEVRLPRPRDLDRVSLVIDPDAPGARVTRVRLTTDQGNVDVDVEDADDPMSVDLPAGSTSRVRVTAIEVGDDSKGFTFGVSELRIPGIELTRPLVTPVVPAGLRARPRISLSSADMRRPGCVRVGTRPLCATGLARPGEESLGIDRIVSLQRAASYDVAITAEPRAGAALQALLSRPERGIVATASSAAVSDPAGSPQSAVDRDLGTGWVAGPGDRAPTLTLRLPEKRRITGVQILVDPALAASLPRRIRVEGGTGRARTGTLDDRGILRFAAVESDVLEISMLDVVANSSFDPYRRTTSFMPVGLSELRLLGADDVRRSTTTGDRSTACGQGPVLRVNGTSVPTRVTTTAQELRSLSRVEVRPCPERPVALTAGDNRLSIETDELWSPVELDLTPADLQLSTAEAVPIQTLAWQRTERRVAVPARDEPVVIVVHENQNDGWTARAGDKQLTPLMIDGWQQGWVLPAGEPSEVTISYRPDGVYRLGLGIGAIAALGLLVLAVWPAHRTTTERSTDRNVGRLTRYVVVLGALALVAGPVGVVAAAVMAAAAQRWHETSRLWLPLLAGAGLSVAGLLLAAEPWASSDIYAGDGWPVQAAAVVGLGAVGAAWIADGQRATLSFARRARRSTSQ